MIIGDITWGTNNGAKSIYQKHMGLTRMIFSNKIVVFCGNPKIMHEINTINQYVTIGTLLDI